MLKLSVLEAKDLAPRDKSSGTADPYVVIRVGSQKHKTGAKKKSLNPMYNETFDLKTDVAKNEEVTVEVWDKDIFKDDFMGHAKISIQTLIAAKKQWLVLEAKEKSTKVVSGQVLLFVDTGADNAKLDTPKGKESKRKGSSSSAASAKAAPPPPEPKKEVQVAECEIPPSNERAYNENDRLAEFRKGAGLTKATKVTVTPSFIDGKYLQTVNTIRPALGLIKLNNQKLRELYGHFFASVKDQERDEISAQIAALLKENNKQLSQIPPLLKQLEKTHKVAEDKLVSEGELRLRKNMFIVLSKAFSEALMEFQEVQNYYEQMHKKTVRRLYVAAKPDATEADLKEVEELSVSQVLQGGVLNDARHQKAKEALAYVKRRHQDILSIEQSLVELRDLFQQVAALVSEQAEFLDKIEANINSTAANVSQGLVELRKARHYQKHRFKISPVQLAALYK